MLKKSLSTALITASIAMASLSVSSSALASGSFKGASGSNHQNSYNVGKAVFYRKLACKTCELSKSDVSKKTAPDIIMRLKNDSSFASKLGMDEKKALIHYLTKRFKLG